MAQNKSSKKSAPIYQAASNRIAAENEEQVKKEVVTKLKHLGPAAATEVVGEAVTKQVTKQFAGFVDFLRENSVLGLAIGLVFGTQVKQLVDSVMASFINPFVSLLLPTKVDNKGQVVLQGFNGLVFTVDLFGKTVEFKYGIFLGAVINFLLIAATVYLIFRIFKLDRFVKRN